MFLFFSSYNDFFNTLWNQEVVTYRGWDEIEELYMDVILSQIEEGETSLIISSFTRGDKAIEEATEIWDKFNEKWKNIKNTDKKILLFPQEEVNIEKDRHEKSGIDTRTVSKSLPQQYKTPLNIEIYDKFLIISDLHEPVYTVYENKNIIESYKKRFEMWWDQKTWTYQGWDEMESLYMNKILPSLSEGDVEYSIASYGKTSGKKARKIEDFYHKYNTKRSKKGVNKKMLMFENERKKGVKAVEKSEQAGLVDIRFLPKKYYSPMSIQIYPDMVVTTASYSNKPFATVYQQGDIVEGYRKQFEMLWDIAEE